MRSKICLVAILVLIVTSTALTASAATLIAGVQTNLYVGEIEQGITTVQMYLDDTPVNFHPDLAALVGQQVLYDGPEFPWHPAPGGRGIHFEFVSLHDQVFTQTVPMDGLSVGPNESNINNSNISDPVSGGHVQLVGPDPTYDYMIFNLNDFNHDPVSLPGGVTVRTNIGISLLMYTGTPPDVPEPATSLLLTVACSAGFALRRR